MTTDSNSMPTEERERVILRFLAERDAMFKPKALFDNLERYEGITFGYKTVKRRLDSLEKKGLVETIGDVGYYEITDRGRDYLAGDLDADELED